MSNTNKNEGRAYIMPKGTPANTEESPTLSGGWKKLTWPMR